MTIKYKIIPFELARIKLSQEINYAVVFRQVTIAAIAKEAGVSPAAVKDIKDDPNCNPEMKTFLGIINALDLDPRDFFQLKD